MSNRASVEKEYIVVKNAVDLQKAIDHISNSEYLAYDTETTGLNVRKDKVIGFSFSGEVGKGFYIPTYEFNVEKNELQKLKFPTDSDVLNILNILKNKDLLMWNASFDIRVTNNFFGVNLTDSLVADVMLMKHTLLEEGEFSLKGVAIEFQKELGLDMEKSANEEQIILKENIEKNGGSVTKTNYQLYKANLDIIGEYACADTDLTLRLANFFLPKIKEEGLESFFFDEEVMPLYKEVTIVMEDKGVFLDIDLMENTKKELEKEMAKLKEEVLDALFEDDRVQEYFLNFLNENYPIKNKGAFVQEYCSYFDLPIPKIASGKFSITKKTVEQLDDSIHKTFLLSGDLDPSFLDVAKDLQYKIHMEREGVEINILSKKQMGEIAFDVLGFKPLSKTAKGQPQFDDDMIQELDSQGVEWASKLSDYNKLIKIKSTYIDRFLDSVEDGIFYPSFFQHRTISGRYGSDMQQLPRPKEEGELRPTPLKYNNLIRKFFVAGKGRKFIDNDYESLEPHVFAHVSGDEGLRDIFRNGHDFYSTIAIATEGLSDYSADKKAENYLGKLNKPKRQSAKAYSLGVPYGMSSYALAMSLGIGKEEGEKLVDGYLSAYPNLRKWMINSERMAKKLGYVKTETGRVRHLDKVKKLHSKYGDDILDFKKKNKIKKEVGEEDFKKMYMDYKNGLNNAKNFQIQGLSASIVNRAAIKINREFKKRKIDAWVALQIHDQLVMNVPEELSEDCAKIVQDIMENNYKLTLKLKAVPQIADNLMDGH